VGLNIKNAEAEAEIRGLAKEMGVGLTEAVLAAVKAARARRAESAAAETEERLREAYSVLAEIDALADVDPRPWRDIEADMYDEGGAPV
jgi:hypothetical protein